jgi:phage tail-like protein
MTAIDTAREDPLTGFHFALEVQGTISGYFTECSGIGSENEVITSNVVNEKGVEVVLKIPGRLKWGDVTLKRGITSNLDLWEWRMMVEEGNVTGARKDGSIVMFDQTLAEVARWNFSQAWPSKISGPAPKSDGNEFSLEEITIVHEYIKRET